MQPQIIQVIRLTLDHFKPFRYWNIFFNILKALGFGVSPMVTKIGDPQFWPPTGRPLVWIFPAGLEVGGVNQCTSCTHQGLGSVSDEHLFESMENPHLSENLSSLYLYNFYIHFIIVSSLLLMVISIFADDSSKNGRTLRIWIPVSNILRYLSKNRMEFSIIMDNIFSPSFYISIFMDEYITPIMCGLFHKRHLHNLWMITRYCR
jgi:hypothetical protein